MAPTRRYLRLTRYSVLETRIYLEQPSLGPTWLLSARSPALPRIIAAIRPLILPKLREENENAKKKGAKKRKATKDTVTGEDFEVALFLTEGGSRHAILRKEKSFAPGGKGRLGGGRRMGVGNAGGEGGEAVVVREESDGEDGLGRRLEDIPLRGQEGEGDGGVVEVSSDEEGVGIGRGRKRKRGVVQEEDGEGEEDKKKLGLKTQYEGFSIYGRILCLIVKRKGVKARAEAPANSSQMLENWVSTQMEQDGVGLDDEG
ncbi:hypothetical protein BDZ85DRAFT_311759 [Elsinoe ampelina]|uniref:Uncharacterized protein n=1 Tax=Elsinoe ampelina TaxID=302913 RepID=A0A6A6GDI7_9PEZI|nr:hypothetical protein BDZ85DRAFT_311759 [Elsinoe ampelina]